MRLTILEISFIIGILFALITSITVVLEFKRQGTQKRTEFFSRKLNEIWKNDLIKRIFFYLDTNDIDKIEVIGREDMNREED